MSLSPGQKLLHYEIVSAIGKGGMGEVYRARDTKLGRDVAVKVLPDELSQDKERLDRFEREARLLAQLNHSNIATLHGLEESDGRKFLVMELVDGETLAERIVRGNVPFDEAVPLFEQIAAGMEAAHEKGIIHRDLKPANIKIPDDGKPKILDFGLAKAYANEDTTGAASSHSPTLTKDTAVGVILGTACYMSPEQARGKAVDRRADIWAFGCCLYEALTGRKAFDAESVGDAVAAIIKSDPDWERLRAPRRMEALIRRCLRKDPLERLRDIGDARIELAELLQDPDPASVERSSESTATRRGLVLIAVVAALVATITAIVISMAARSDSTPTRRFAIDLPAIDELDFGGGTSIALSPDGERLIFTGSRNGTKQLFVRRLDEWEARPLDGTEGAQHPFVSPNGERVGFFQGPVLKTVPITGGPVTTVCDVGASRSFGADWVDDHTIIFSAAGRGLFRVSVSDGVPAATTELDAGDVSARHRWPKSLPEDRGVLFAGTRTDFMAGGANILVYSYGESRPEILIENGTNPSYLPGYILFARDAALWAAPFDAETLALRGGAVRIVEDLQVNSGGAALFAISEEGDLVFVAGRTGTPSLMGTLLWVDRNGVSTPARPASAHYGRPRLSPDERYVAVSIQDETRDLWLYDIERGTTSRLTLGDWRSSDSPIWMPDQSRLFFSAYQLSKDTTNVRWLPPDRRAAGGIVFESDMWDVPTGLSPDGRFLALTRERANEAPDVWILSLGGNGEATPLLTSSYDESWATFSPSGPFIAYQSDESGRNEIYVQTFPGSGPRWQISSEGGQSPVWSRDGTELFYRDGGALLAVPIQTDPDFEAGRPAELFRGDYLTEFDVTADGRFLMVQPTAERFREVRVVLNWFSELERLVPTN